MTSLNCWFDLINRLKCQIIFLLIYLFFLNILSIFFKFPGAGNSSIDLELKWGVSADLPGNPPFFSFNPTSVVKSRETPGGHCLVRSNGRLRSDGRNREQHKEHTGALQLTGKSANEPPGRPLLPGFPQNGWVEGVSPKKGHTRNGRDTGGGKLTAPRRLKLTG